MNTKRKLEFKDIAGYLPYKLKTTTGILALVNTDYEGHQLETKSWDGEYQLYSELCK